MPPTFASLVRRLLKAEERKDKAARAVLSAVEKCSTNINAARRFEGAAAKYKMHRAAIEAALAEMGQ